MSYDVICLFIASSSDLQKIKRTIDSLYTEKQKMEKEKSKKGGKGKTKARLRMEEDNVWTLVVYINLKCSF